MSITSPKLMTTQDMVMFTWCAISLKLLKSFENLRLRQKSNWVSIISSFDLTNAMNT